MVARRRTNRVDFRSRGEAAHPHAEVGRRGGDGDRGLAAALRMVGGRRSDRVYGCGRAERWRVCMGATGHPRTLAETGTRFTNFRGGFERWLGEAGVAREDGVPRRAILESRRKSVDRCL